MPQRRMLTITALALAACLAAGCERKAARVPRDIGGDALGALTPEALREAYETPAFVVRDTRQRRHVAFQDTDLAAEALVDDINLLIYVEGSGDRIPLSRWTMRLLAESDYGFPSRPDRLVVVLLKWGETHDVVAEHTNRKGQMAGAATLNRMLEVHRRRHGGRGHVSVIGFSAGTRVTQWAFAGNLPEAETAYPDALAHARNVVFLGSSISCADETPFERVGGRFLSFINPRDTHYGDRAPFVAPAGETPRFGKFLTLEPVLRHPMFGASVMGFRHLPTLTNREQFDAIEQAADPATRRRLERVFRMVNVPVPDALVPFNLFGDPVPNDDADDYLNLAPNHYVLVGRGPAGRIDDPAFDQYRGVAKEFVREHVASAALRGRLFRFDLEARPKSAKLLDVPLPLLFPWAAIHRPEPESDDEPPPKAPPEEKAPPEKKPAAPEAKTK
ncbi:MAG: hypothetical protein R6X20_18560 [Phycisphaerae bacterium]